MFWFLASMLGGFYLFWKTTAPKESEVRAQELLALQEAQARAEEEAAAAPLPDQPDDTLRGLPDQPEDTLRGDTPLVEVVGTGTPPPEGVKPYNPEDNPFRKQDPTPHPDRHMDNGEPSFPGSFDDIIPDDTPLEDFISTGDEEDDDGYGV